MRLTDWLQLARLAELQEKLEAMSLSTGEGLPSPLRLLSGIQTPRYMFSRAEVKSDDSLQKFLPL